MNMKRLAKQALLIEGFCIMLGLTGCIFTLVGGGLAAGGLAGIGLVRTGHAVEKFEPLLKKMSVNGSLFFSVGLITCGGALALAQLSGLRVTPEEIAELFQEVNDSRKPENRLRTYTEWETYQIVTKQCSTCTLYRMHGNCAKHGEIKMMCPDHTKVNSCEGCKYYSWSTSTLKCAVHPDLPIDCVDKDMGIDV